MHTAIPQSSYSRPNYILWPLIAAPFAAFAAYIAWIIVPIIVSEVVPAVVQAVTTSK
jgi:cobalamin synthase